MQQTQRLASPGAAYSHKPNSKMLRAIEFLKQKPMTHLAEEMENQTNQPTNRILLLLVAVTNSLVKKKW
jgi:hypothetical protein